MGSFGCFPIVSLLASTFALIFLGIGLIGQGWIVFDMNIHNDELNLEESVSIGLWAVGACVDTGLNGEVCATVTMDQLGEAMANSRNSHGADQSQAFFGHFLPIQLLMASGSFLAICGFILLCVHIRNSQFNFDYSSTKSTGIWCALCFGISAILVFAAVGTEGQQNTNIANGIQILNHSDNEALEGFEMKLHFPWAIVMAGIGGIFSVIAGLAVSLRLCNSNGMGNSDAEILYKNMAI